MSKMKNHLSILCAAAFCFTLALAGCNVNKKASSSDTSETTGDFTVTFDSRGGSEVEPQHLKKGEKAVKPANPSKSGYKFVNWFEEEEAATPFDFNTEITSNWTLYAGWLKNGSAPTPPTPDPDPDPQPQPVDYDYYIYVDGIAHGLTKNESATLDVEHQQTAEYTCTLERADAGNSVQFYDGETPITSNIGHDNSDAEHDNASGGEGGVYAIRTTGAYLNVYFKVWGEKAGFSFWITGYEPDAPVASSYYVEIAGVLHEMSVNTNADLSTGATAEYTTTVNFVNAGETVKFFIGDNQITDHIGHNNMDAANNNAEGGEGGVYAIRTSSDSVDVYLQVWDNGSGYSFWITGYEAADPVYSVKVGTTVYPLGLNGSATLAPGQTAEYMGNIATAEAGDEIQFFVASSAITEHIGHSNMDAANNNAEGGTGGVYTIRTGGENLMAYLQTWADGYSFWITGYTGGGSGTTSEFYVKVGAAEKVELVLNPDATLYEGQTAEYYAHFDTLTQGEEVIFYEGDNAITANIGPDMGQNNIVKDGSTFTIRNDATNANIYFKTWATGLSFFVEGYQVIPGSEITYTGTDLPNWLGNDNAVLFAWVWNASGSQWVEAELAAGGATLTFNVEEELTGFKLVRCRQGTTVPSWTETENVPGKIYNQTGDITCSAGVHTYSCSSWN